MNGDKSLVKNSFIQRKYTFYNVKALLQNFGVHV